MNGFHSSDLYTYCQNMLDRLFQRKDFFSLLSNSAVIRFLCQKQRNPAGKSRIRKRAVFNYIISYRLIRILPIPENRNFLQVNGLIQQKDIIRPDFFLIRRINSCIL